MQPNPRVLCVDDDEDARYMLKNLLDTLRIEASTVGTASEALSLIRSEPYALYVIDVWLPDLDGFELCRRLRESDSKTPILFYSGAAYETDKQKGIAAGANAYVTKPNVDALLETLTDLMARTGADKVVPAWTSRQPAPIQNSLFDSLLGTGAVQD